MKVEYYDDMLEKFTGNKVISFTKFGSCQGSWVAAVKNGNEVELWKGSYGSCSGCDFIQSVRDWTTHEIEDDEVKNYFREERPFLSIEETLLKEMSLSEFDSIVPRNIRKELYDFDSRDLYTDIVSALKE